MNRLLTFFPALAANHLRHASRLRFRHAVPVAEEALRVAAQSRWPMSYGFRRFTLLFKRLHDLLRSEPGAVTFVDQNIVDYMILGCLVVERMVSEWWRASNPTAHLTPPLDQMLEDVAADLTKRLRCAPIGTLLHAHKQKSKLHSLKAGGRLPLLTTRPRTARQFAFTTLHNLRVLRNYSAHHDCLDFELSFGREGAKAMRVIVGPLRCYCRSSRDAQERTLP